MGKVIPGVGRVVYVESPGWYETQPRDIPILGAQGVFAIDHDYPLEVEPQLAECINAFCALTPAALDAAKDAVYAYYRHIADGFGADDCDEYGIPAIASSAQVWDHVQLTDSPYVHVRGGIWYVMLDNDCAWEQEHGLMIVWRQGQRVSRVSAYDGHVSNQDAWGGDCNVPPDAIYWTPFSDQQ